jgi:Bacterial mobilisation protein (MobC)
MSIPAARHRPNPAVPLAAAEYEAIATRAAETNVSIQWLLLAGAHAFKPPTAAPSALTAELAGLRRLLANIANNINQIARKLNSGGWPDASIAPAADALRRTMRRLDAALETAARSASPEQPVRGADPPSPRPEPVREHPGSPRIAPQAHRNTPRAPA